MLESNQSVEKQQNGLWDHILFGGGILATAGIAYGFASGDVTRLSELPWEEQSPEKRQGYLDSRNSATVQMSEAEQQLYRAREKVHEELIRAHNNNPDGLTYEKRRKIIKEAAGNMENIYDPKSGHLRSLKNIENAIKKAAIRSIRV